MRSRALLISAALHAVPVVALAWSGHLELLGSASEGGSGWARLYPVVLVGEEDLPPAPIPAAETASEAPAVTPDPVPEAAAASLPSPLSAAQGGGAGGPVAGEGDSLGSAGELGGPVWNPRPAYPARAREAGWEGRVEVALSVRADGRVVEARLLSSSGHDLLDRSALEALRAWRFALRDPGASVVVIHQEVLFRLEAVSVALNKEGSS